MRNLSPLKPQDVLLLLQLLVETGLKQNAMASKLEISQTEVSMGLKRLEYAGLIDSAGEPAHEACEEYLIHGLKYSFPTRLGTLTAGIPTAHSKPGLRLVKQSNGEVHVWPDAKGTQRGIAIYPIHPSFPAACKKDERLYEMSALLEMIRVGRTREQNLASKKLRKLITGSI